MQTSKNTQPDADAWPPHRDEIQRAIVAAMQSGSWSKYSGEYSAALQETLQTHFERRHAQLCGSGTIAVELALRGCQIQPEDEVLLAGYDYPGNFRAVEAIGAKVVLVDVASNNWTFQDIQALEEARSDNTKAVIVSHLHGAVANMRLICGWAEQHQINIIEDACQAIGARLCGRAIGSWGDVSVLSFGGSKLLTAGRGGAVLTNSARIDQRMRICRERGNDAYPMSELQAAALLPQLNRFSESISHQSSVVAWLEHRLAGHPSICIPQRLSLDQNGFYKWAFLINESTEHDVDSMRARCLQQLELAGIRAGGGFHGFHYRSSNRCRRAGNLSNCVRAAQATITIHHTMLLGGEVSAERILRALMLALPG